MKLLQKIFQDMYIVFAIIYMLILITFFRFAEPLPIRVDIIGITSLILLEGKLIYTMKGE